ncbi:MAG: hypothetical protein ACREJQ_03400 [bacterium]
MKTRIHMQGVAVTLLLALLFVIAATKPAAPKSKKPANPPAPSKNVILQWAPNSADIDKYSITIDVKGTARVTVFNQTATGLVNEAVTLQKIEDMPNGLLRMQVKCKIEKSTLSPKVLTSLMCSDNSDFLMHPMNPFNVGLYPFPPDSPKKIGDEWPYNTTWSDASQQGKIDAKYKLVDIQGDLAVVDAVIKYEADIKGFLKQHQETESNLKTYINTKNGKLTKVTGKVKSKGNVPTTSYDVTADIAADLLNP